MFGQRSNGLMHLSQHNERRWYALRYDGWTRWLRRVDNAARNARRYCVLIETGAMSLHFSSMMRRKARRTRLEDIHSTTPHDTPYYTPQCTRLTATDIRLSSQPK